jgi:pyruvate/2-oxoglutarate dehydrogenase complex dihydrolipoamide acyltransferase (E2) component
MTDVIVEDDAWAEGDATEAVIGMWIYQDGATVKAGDVLGEMMVIKSQTDIVAPADGTLKIVAQTDSLVKKGDVLCRIIGKEKVRVRVKAA